MKARVMGSALVALALAVAVSGPGALGSAPHAGRTSGSAGLLVLRLGHAARTSEGVRRQGVLHGRRSRGIRAAHRRAPRRRPRRPCARVARLREARRRRSADVAHHRPARRPRAAADAGRAREGGRAAGADTEWPRRQPRGPSRAGAVPRVRRGAAAAAGSVQQQHADRADAGRRGRAQRDDPRCADRGARRTPRTAGGDAVLAGLVARTLGRRHAQRRDDELRGAVSFRGSDEHLRVVERFTLDGPDALRYEFTIDDPTAFTRPWTGAFTMTRTQRQDLRVRVSRGQLRADEHPARGPRGGAGGRKEVVARIVHYPRSGSPRIPYITSPNAISVVGTMTASSVKKIAA